MASAQVVQLSLLFTQVLPTADGEADLKRMEEPSNPSSLRVDGSPPGDSCYPRTPQISQAIGRYIVKTDTWILAVRGRLEEGAELRRV